jgi:ATP-binding cassette subfamily B protein
MLIALWHKLNLKRKKQFVGIALLMVLASLSEVISIGIIFPFLGMLTAPEKIMHYSVVQTVVNFFNISTPSEMLLVALTLFVVSVVFAGIIRLTLLYANTRFSYAIGADLSLDVYRRALYQPYSTHISQNSSEVINAINGKTAMIIGSILVPVTTLLSASILFIGIFLAVIAINALVALALVIFFGFIYYLILRFTKKSLQQNSECIARESSQVIKSLQEGLGGIRDVLLDGTQEIYCKIYQQADLPLRLAQGNNSFISASPRFLIEMIGMILVAFAAFYLTKNGEENGEALVIPILGALALAAQRILPVLQQGYSSLAIMRGAKASLGDVLIMLDQPLPSILNRSSAELITYKKNITLENVGFAYSKESPFILSNINIEIHKGQRVGFIGATGAGKSTLLDIVMGLLSPTEGVLAIDGQSIDSKNIRKWQNHIAHVPQSIYLADSSIEENIAFGLPAQDIDHFRVRLAASQAQISHVIESWPLQYRTKIGERGIRLSGGQRQRIGIARALYKQASVIIFDEATSALDGDTEKMVMDAVDGLNKDLTILIIAHRLTTLKNCDIIVELERGKIKRVGKYSSLVNI